ncbi:MAG TPA: hypothetical protein VGC50_14645, partial [Gammaproteobacteria bacterium]
MNRVATPALERSLIVVAGAEMAETANGGISGLTSEEVRRICGDLSDWKVSAILETHATIGDL